MTLDNSWLELGGVVGTRGFTFGPAIDSTGYGDVGGAQGIPVLFRKASSNPAPTKAVVVQIDEKGEGYATRGNEYRNSCLL